MYGVDSLQLVSFIYIVVLSMVYFLKRKYNFVESTIYKFLLIITMIVLVLDIFSSYIVFKNVDVGNLLLVIS